MPIVVGLERLANPRTGEVGPLALTLWRVTWEEDATREEGRYADAVGRLPEDPARRQKQLVRAAMTAGGAGLARLMQGRDEEATAWFLRSAERYRESWADAPPESW